MPNYTLKTAQTIDECVQIADLQRQNLPQHLSLQQQSEQGFVTVQHSVAMLWQLNQAAPHVIALSEGRVVAYVLAMTAAAQRDIPVLEPMFEQFEQIEYRSRRVSAYRYIVVGQACVADGYRGQGILDACYAYYRQIHAPRFAFAITEIAAHNPRSLRAHSRIGFETIAQYTAPDLPIEWHIVLWDWQN